MEYCSSSVGLVTIDEKIVGVSLGFSPASEHEHGIRGIRDAFGHKEHKNGFDALVNTKVPEGYLYKRFRGSDPAEAVLIYSRQLTRYPEQLEKIFPGARPLHSTLKGIPDDVKRACDE